MTLQRERESCGAAWRCVAWRSRPAKVCCAVLVTVVVVDSIPPVHRIRQGQLCCNDVDPTDHASSLTDNGVPVLRNVSYKPAMLYRGWLLFLDAIALVLPSRTVATGPL